MGKEERRKQKTNNQPSNRPTTKTDLTSEVSPNLFLLPFLGSDGEWKTLAADIADCCYYAKNLSRDVTYCFRIACTSKAGMGPYSSPSAAVKISGKDQLGKSTGRALYSSGI